jgi:hypothetical protein
LAASKITPQVVGAFAEIFVAFSEIVDGRHGNLSKVNFRISGFVRFF